MKIACDLPVSTVRTVATDVRAVATTAAVQVMEAKTKQQLIAIVTGAGRQSSMDSSSVTSLPIAVP
jgi:hypothetical protein